MSSSNATNQRQKAPPAGYAKIHVDAACRKGVGGGIKGPAPVETTIAGSPPTRLLSSFPAAARPPPSTPPAGSSPARAASSSPPAPPSPPSRLRPASSFRPSDLASPKPERPAPALGRAPPPSPAGGGRGGRRAAQRPGAPRRAAVPVLEEDGHELGFFLMQAGWVGSSSASASPACHSSPLMELTFAGTDKFGCPPAPLVRGEDRYLAAWKSIFQINQNEFDLVYKCLNVELQEK
ncbi:transcription initiation factor TFIID subunit 4 [Triticum aestivum]|uniref:transcription initiation factor TFIID subunit 4 n=1 Tax=Triticum aestivum TaxID=4565 RepID=UPI001D0176AF|nr:transcription initiation factor TFIID subunit 4-like [Triticum aestivum]